MGDRQDHSRQGHHHPTQPVSPDRRPGRPARLEAVRRSDGSPQVVAGHLVGHAVSRHTSLDAHPSARRHGAATVPVTAASSGSTSPSQPRPPPSAQITRPHLRQRSARPAIPSWSGSASTWGFSGSYRGWRQRLETDDWSCPGLVDTVSTGPGQDQSGQFVRPSSGGRTPRWLPRARSTKTNDAIRSTFWQSTIVPSSSTVASATPRSRVVSHRITYHHHEGRPRGASISP
jgi:hypothetical protein